jgi:flagellar assembly protein FliH
VSIQSFQYDSVPEEETLPAWDGWAESEENEEDESSVSAAPVHESHHESNHEAVQASLRAEFDLRLSEETRRATAVGHEMGLKEGRQAERDAQAAAHAEAEKQRMRQAAGLLESFNQERERYLHAVEHEVVKLALAVAARILRREAQMDPLLLTGAVRVALGQLSASTQVRLRVPAAELDLWTESMALVPNLTVKPTVVAGERMLLGDCVIETEMGSVDLGIRSQLGEIERGFFDRAIGCRNEASEAADSGQKVGA